MSEYNNKNFTQMKNPFLDFLKVDERLNECLRRGWLLIEDLFKTLEDL